MKEEKGKESRGITRDIQKKNKEEREREIT